MGVGRYGILLWVFNLIQYLMIECSGGKPYKSTPVYKVKYIYKFIDSLMNSS